MVTIDGFIIAYDEQVIPAWSATLLGAMRMWAGDPRVIERADAAMGSDTAVVREAAAGVFARNRDVERLQKAIWYRYILVKSGPIVLSM